MEGGGRGAGRGGRGRERQGEARRQREGGREGGREGERDQVVAIRLALLLYRKLFHALHLALRLLPLALADPLFLVCMYRTRKCRQILILVHTRTLGDPQRLLCVLHLGLRLLELRLELLIDIRLAGRGVG
jgi:hypothetical protein